jgi:hypothetical protein
MSQNTLDLLAYRQFRSFLAALAVMVFAMIWHHNITGALIHRDGAENLQPAINLSHHGVSSAENQTPHNLSMIREPTPFSR